MEYRLIALDLDGTLLGSDKEISPRNRKALAAARERGIVTVIATGRSAHSARMFSQQVGGGPVICCNGAEILESDGSVITQRPLPLAPLLRVIALCEEERLLCECYTSGRIVLDRPAAHAATYFRWVRGRRSTARATFDLVRIWQLNRMRWVRSLRKWAEMPDREPVLKLMIIGPREGLERLAERIEREAPGLAVTSSGHENIEVGAAGVSKGAALELLGARLKIPRQAMVAVGDGANDLEMLRYAGLGVAMGNASEGVKSAADRVTATCDDDGVARLVEEVLLA